MKTEREKMLAGEAYDCSNPDLLSRWHMAKDLVREYNQLDSLDGKKKSEILQRLLGKVKNEVWITAPFFVDYGENIYLGEGCEINMNCTFLDDNIIKLGDRALIAPNVQIYTAYHPTSAKERFVSTTKQVDFSFCQTLTAPVIIGNDVWIGGGAIIMPGVTIGDNVVIGAGSVVTKDIPSNVVAYGNPCRIQRKNN